MCSPCFQTTVKQKLHALSWCPDWSHFVDQNVGILTPSLLRKWPVWKIGESFFFFRVSLNSSTCWQITQAPPTHCYLLHFPGHCGIKLCDCGQLAELSLRLLLHGKNLLKGNCSVYYKSYWAKHCNNHLEGAALVVLFFGAEGLPVSACSFTIKMWKTLWNFFRRES